MELTNLADGPVKWSYEMRDEMISELTHKDGHKRAFAAQVLALFTISDPRERILCNFPKLAEVLRDEKTLTARHTLQDIWRVGLAGLRWNALVVEALAIRFQECSREKNSSRIH